MPQSFTNQERINLLNTLRTGRSQAIRAVDLARTLGYSTGGNQVKLRSLIKFCIETHGDLIGAATGQPAGFFLIGNVNELNTYLDSLQRRTQKDNDRRSALIDAWNASNSPTSRMPLTLA